MNQTSSIHHSVVPPQLSPEFKAWIAKEKSEARLHRKRILQATLFIIAGCALFLLKVQLRWGQDALNLVPAFANQ